MQDNEDIEVLSAAADALETPMPKSAVELAMERVPVHDYRSTVAVQIGQNPFVQKKEAIIAEVTHSKYQLRRSGLIRPERGRMLVARMNWDEKIGSMFLLDQQKKQLQQTNMEAIVLGCGDLRIDPVTGKEVPMRFTPRESLGKHIIMREHAGLEFMWYDENGKEWTCYLIGQSEIWAWLEPPPGSDTTVNPDLEKTLRYIQSGIAMPGEPTIEECNEPCAMCERHCTNMHAEADGHFCPEHA